MEVGTIVKEYKNGVLREFVTENGEKFQAYIPYECNSKTPIMIYEHGDNGYTSNWQVYEADLYEKECNSIIIRGDRKNKINDYNYLVQQYNLDTPQPITVSFSGGTPSAMNETAMMIQATQGQVPGVAVILDGYAPAEHLESRGVLDTFRNSNSVVLGFAQKGGNRQYVVQYENLAKKGVNTLILYDQSSYGQSHSGVNQSFMKQNLYDYILGTGKLPENYVIKRYDSTSQSFVEVDINEVSTIKDVYKYFGIDTSTISNLENGLVNFGITSLKSLSLLDDVKSDNHLLSSSLNGIRGAIRGTSFLQGTSLSSGFASTTKVPSELPSIVSSYISSTGTLLQRIATDTENFAKIGTSIIEIDQETAQESENLSDILTGVGTGTVLGSTLSNQIPTGTSETNTNNQTNTAVTNSQTSSNNTSSNTTNTTTSNKTTSSNTNSNTQSNNTSSNNSNSNHSSNNNSNNNNSSSTNTNQNNQTSQEKGGIETFHDYDKLVSDETKIVYNCNDEYKVIIHKDGDKITGIEYYYDYGTEEAATKALETLNNNYKTVEHFDKLFQKERYVKVLFKEEMFKGLSLQQIKEKFVNLQEITKL